MVNNNFRFTEAERPREELELPALHFIAMDDWVEVIGEKAFISWLKMFTWCDRKGAKNNPNLWNESRVPKSLTKIAKDLKVGKATFYNKILKPLWNVGLIDLVEYEDSKLDGTKPLNIIVYKYPQNKFELSVKPLEKIRDYDKDYSSEAKTFALRKREKKEKLSDEQLEQIDDLFKENNGGSEQERGPVLNENGGGFSNKTEGGSEIEHNNIFNPINNTSNSINNTSNTNNNNLNLNLIDELWKLDIPMDLRKKIKIKVIDENINISYKQLSDLEHAYHYQMKKGTVIPNANVDEDGLNEKEFTDTIMEMLDSVNLEEIDSMRAMIDKWATKGFSYKFDKIRNLILS